MWRGLALFGAMCLVVLGYRANLHVVIITIICAIFALYVDIVTIWLHLSQPVRHPPSRRKPETCHDRPDLRPKPAKPR